MGSRGGKTIAAVFEFQRKSSVISNGLLQPQPAWMGKRSSSRSSGENSSPISKHAILTPANLPARLEHPFVPQRELKALQRVDGLLVECPSPEERCGYELLLSLLTEPTDHLSPLSATLQVRAAVPPHCTLQPLPIRLFSVTHHHS